MMATLGVMCFNLVLLLENWDVFGEGDLESGELLTPENLRWEGKVLVAFKQKALNSKECQQLVPYQLDSYERNFFKKQENRIFFVVVFCWFSFFLKTAQRCVLKGMEAQEHYLKGFYIISDMEFKRSVSQDAWPSADIKLQANLTGGGKKRQNAQQ